MGCTLSLLKNCIADSKCSKKHCNDGSDSLCLKKSELNLCGMGSGSWKLPKKSKQLINDLVCKDHKNEQLESEYNKIRQNNTSSLKAIEAKLEICDKNLDEYNRCILAISTTDGAFMKSEKFEKDEFYWASRNNKLDSVDGVIFYRVENLESLKNQCVQYKNELDNMRTLLRGFEEMGKQDLIENVDSLEKLAVQNIDQQNISEVTRLHNLSQKITIAVYFVVTGHQVTPLPSWLFDLENVWKVEKTNDGKIYNYNDGRSIFSLTERPTDNTVDLSRYKYTVLVDCNTCDGIDAENLLKEQIENKWCSRIIISVIPEDWRDEEFMERMRNIAKTDERVEIMRCPRWKFNEVLFQK